jgi:hypothetical protein
MKAEPMNAKISAWAMIGLLAIAGCIPSLNSVYQTARL